MENTYGCIRTSRQRIEGSAGSDPEAQAHLLRQEGVPEANIYRDVGISGGTGTNSRAGWRALDSKLVSGILWWQWPSMAWSLGRIGSSVREVGTDVEKAAAAVATGASCLRRERCCGRRDPERGHGHYPGSACGGEATVTDRRDRERT